MEISLGREPLLTYYFMGKEKNEKKSGAERD